MDSLYVRSSRQEVFEEGVKLGDLRKDCKVYLFVFTGIWTLNKRLQDDLKDWGSRTGRNLFVGIWSEDDSDWGKVVRFFDLGEKGGSLPAIVMTAESGLAYMDLTQESVYARISNLKILRLDDLAELAEKTVQRLYVLFHEHKFKDAIGAVKRADREQRLEVLKGYLSKIKDVFGQVGKFLSDHDVSIKLGAFEFSSKKSEAQKKEGEANKK